MSLNKPLNNLFEGDLFFGGSFARSKDLKAKSVDEIRGAYADQSDAALVTLFMSGKGDAFTALVDRHASMVYRFTYRYLQDADTTNDVVQDVFVKVWKNIKKFDTTKNFKTWLLTIAKNTSLDFLKKKKPVLFSHIEESDTDLDAFLAPFMESPALPNELLDQKILQGDMQMVLADLSASHRNILFMRYTDHLKFREIAEILQEPIDTVKSKHRRALIALRKALART